MWAIQKTKVKVAAEQYLISSIDPKAQTIMAIEEKEAREWELKDKLDNGNTTSLEVKNDFVPEIASFKKDCDPVGCGASRWV